MENSLVGYRSIYGHHAPPALPTNSTISHKPNTKAQLFHRRWTTRLVLRYDNDTGRQLREFLLNDNKITILIHLKICICPKMPPPRECRPGRAAPSAPPRYATAIQGIMLCTPVTSVWWKSHGWFGCGKYPSPRAVVSVLMADILFFLRYWIFVLWLLCCLPSRIHMFGVMHTVPPSSEIDLNNGRLVSIPKLL